MHEWLVLLLTFLVAPVTLVAGAFAVVAKHLHRANQLLPGRRSRNAPLRWLWSPSLPAMMHRRLRLACQLAGAAVPVGTALLPGSRPRSVLRRQRAAPPDAIAELARDVVREAATLDEHVVTASCMARGLPRAQALDDLERKVRAIEDAARRVNQLASRRNNAAKHLGGTSLSLDQRIKAMEEAFGELTSPPQQG